MRYIKLYTILLMLFSVASLFADECVDCHQKIQPNIVIDWELSKHSQNEVTCETCHGDAHQSDTDFAYATIPTPQTCSNCHETQVEQFSKGKHALAWTAMKAMPTIHHQPASLIDGMKGCGGCHKIGLKDEGEISKLNQIIR